MFLSKDFLALFGFFLTTHAAVTSRLPLVSQTPDGQVQAPGNDGTLSAGAVEGFLLTIGTPATLTQPVGISSWNSQATPTLTTVVTISGKPQTVTVGPTDKPIPLMTISENNGGVIACVQTTYSAMGARTGCISGWEQTLSTPTSGTMTPLDYLSFTQTPGAPAATTNKNSGGISGGIHSGGIPTNTNTEGVFNPTATGSNPSGTATDGETLDTNTGGASVGSATGGSAGGTNTAGVPSNMNTLPGASNGAASTGTNAAGVPSNTNTLPGASNTGALTGTNTGGIPSNTNTIPGASNGGASTGTNTGGISANSGAISPSSADGGAPIATSAGSNPTGTKSSEHLVNTGTGAIPNTNTREGTVNTGTGVIPTGTRNSGGPLDTSLGANPTANSGGGPVETNTGGSRDGSTAGNQAPTSAGGLPTTPGITGTNVVPQNTGTRGSPGQTPAPGPAHTTGSPDIFANPSQSNTVITASGITGTYSLQTFSEYATLTGTTTITTDYPVTKADGSTSETHIPVIVGPGGVHWEPTCNGILCPGGGGGGGGGGGPPGAPPCLGLLCGGGGGSDSGGDDGGNPDDNPDNDPDDDPSSTKADDQPSSTKNEDQPSSTSKEDQASSTAHPSSSVVSSSAAASSTGGACLPRTTMWPLPSYTVGADVSGTGTGTGGPIPTSGFITTTKPKSSQGASGITSAPGPAATTTGDRPPGKTITQSDGTVCFLPDGSTDPDCNQPPVTKASSTVAKGPTSASIQMYTGGETRPTNDVKFCQTWKDCPSCPEDGGQICAATWEISVQSPGHCGCTTNNA
ncbi:MAG: hypothetical protein Q9181_006157 [Wetmoreana brouardii]